MDGGEETRDKHTDLEFSQQCNKSPAQQEQNRIRRRAGTWGGRSSQQQKNDDNKDWRRNLLGVKKKFSRKNAWGNCSYKALIVEAIEQSPNKKLTLNEIYDWIVTNIPHFSGEGETNSSAGWKNSIRHNLSLHAVFVKEPQFQQNGTKAIGCYWTLDKSREPRKRCHTTDPTQKDMALRRKQQRAQRASTSGLASPGSAGGHLAKSPASLPSPVNTRSIENSDSGMSPGSSQSSLDSKSFNTEQLVHSNRKMRFSSETSELSPPKIEMDTTDPMSPPPPPPPRKPELLDVEVTVPYELYDYYANKGYQFFVLDTAQVLPGHKVVPNPNPRPCPIMPKTEPPPVAQSSPLVKSERESSINRPLSELSINDECFVDPFQLDILPDEAAGLNQYIEFSDILF